MPESHLESFRAQYNIPTSMTLHLPEESETKHNSPKECIALYMKMFEFEFRLPLHPLSKELLSKVNRAPSQVAPIGWGILYGLRVVWLLENEEVDDPIPLSTDHLLACFEVKRAPRTGNRFYLCAQKIFGTVIEGSSSLKK